MNDSLSARNALAAFLMISASSTSTLIRGPASGAYRSSTASIACVASANHPTTTRLGRAKSATAVPWRKNSGLMTSGSGKPRAADGLPCPADRHRAPDDHGVVGPGATASRRAPLELADSPAVVADRRSDADQDDPRAGPAGSSLDRQAASGHPGIEGASCSPSSWIGMRPLRSMSQPAGGPLDEVHVTTEP